MSSEINKLSNLVSNHLKIVDKRITGNEQFHWNRLKRTPQILKQKIKFAGGSYTVDQTFNELDEVDKVHKSLWWKYESRIVQLRLFSRKFPELN